MIVKKFKELKEGDYLFCATNFGVFNRSLVYKVEVGKKIVKVWHKWYGGQQNLNADDSCKNCGGFLCYVATTQDELAKLLCDGIEDLNTKLRLIESQKQELQQTINYLHEHKEIEDDRTRKE